MAFQRVGDVIPELLEELTSADQAAANDLRWGDYSPPYESPIEQIFAWHLVKHLSEDVELTAQHRSGEYRLDFAASGESIRGIIAFECDGREFHDYSLDEERDREILERGEVRAIYRLRGTDISSRIHDVLALIAYWDPMLFTPRSHGTIRALRSRDVLDAGYFRNQVAAVRFATHACGEGCEGSCHDPQGRGWALYVERRDQASMAPSCRGVARLAFKCADVLSDVSHVLPRRPR